MEELPRTPHPQKTAGQSTIIVDCLVIGQRGVAGRRWSMGTPLIVGAFAGIGRVNYRHPSWCPGELLHNLPTMPIYDEHPRPRVLVSGVSGTETEFMEVVERYSGTVQVVRGAAPAIRWESWDALICVDEPRHTRPHLVILQVGGTPHGLWEFTVPDSSLRTRHYLKLSKSYGVEFRTNDELDGALKSLVKAELIPLLRDSAIPRDVLKDPEFNSDDSYFIPLITDLDGGAYAAIYRPDGEAREVIYLPSFVTDIQPWLLYAFERWSAFDPESFPVAPDWTNAAEWMTAEEIDARETWVAACEAAEKARVEEERVEQESQSALRELREKADDAERILLTGTADELVQAVRLALIRLGFAVEDQDALGARERLEDLRVHDGDWIALCEVKGYTGGGKVTDFLKIGRFVERYLKETKGESPDARWYVVNQFRERDPSSRKQLLWGQDADVEGFAESGGLMIDTRSIFLLDKAVKGGAMESVEARRLLRESTGRFTYGL